MNPGHRTIRPSTGSGATVANRLVPTLLVAVLVLLAGGLALAVAVGPVAAEDGPVLADGEKVNDSTIDLWITDENGVDLGSIDSSEFFLSDGAVASIDVFEEGTDARVRLYLEAPVDVDEIVVDVASTTGIQNVDGQQLDVAASDPVVIEDMDGVPPALRDVDIPAVSNDTAVVDISFDELVGNLSMTVSGPVEKTLTRADFEHTGAFRYRSLIDLPVDGHYDVELVNATDEAGNTATFDVSAAMEVDNEPPDAVVILDRHNSSGQNIAFDAGLSSPDVVNYTWQFGDGRETTGEQVSHAFHSGVYRVTLEATDELGNVDRDELVVNVTGAVGDIRVGSAEWPAQHQVEISYPGPNIPPDVLVTLRGVQANETIAVEPPVPGEALATGGDVSLSHLEVNTSIATSLGIGITGSTDRPAALEAVIDPATTAVLGGVSIQPSVGDGVIAEASATLDVDAEALAELPVGPENVSVYRTADEEVETVDSEILDDTNDVVRFALETDGFSTLTVVATDLPDEDDEDEATPDSDDGEDETDAGEQDDDGEHDDADTDEETEDDEAAGDATDDDETETDETTEDDTDDEATDDEATDDEADDGNTETEDTGDGDQEEQAGTDTTGNETADSDSPGNETDSLPEEFDDQEWEDEEDDDGGSTLWSLLTTFIFYLVLPAVVIFGSLKGLAIYLGY